MPVTRRAEADVTTEPSRPPDGERVPHVTDKDTEFAFLCLKPHCWGEGWPGVSPAPVWTQAHPHREAATTGSILSSWGAQRWRTWADAGQ